MRVAENAAAPSYAEHDSENLWSQEGTLYGDILFGSPNDCGPLVVSNLAWFAQLRVSEVQQVIRLSHLNCLKIETPDFVVDVSCHLLNVEHDPLIRRIAEPDVVDGPYNDWITPISHRLDEESDGNFLSTESMPGCKDSHYE